jgi:hypothetical protein
MLELEIDMEWLDASESLNLTELARTSEMSVEDLSELIEYGALTPLPTSAQETRFSAQCLAPLQAAAKLRRDYDLDLFATGILMDYIRRIEALEGQIRSMQATQF